MPHNPHGGYKTALSRTLVRDSQFICQQNSCLQKHTCDVPLWQVSQNPPDIAYPQPQVGESTVLLVRRCSSSKIIQPTIEGLPLSRPFLTTGQEWRGHRTSRDTIMDYFIGAPGMIQGQASKKGTVKAPK